MKILLPQFEGQDIHRVYDEATGRTTDKMAAQARVQCNE